MFTIVDTLDKLKDSYKQLKNETLLACDLEASELDIKIADITGIGYGTVKNTFFIPFPHTIPKGELATYLTKLFEKTIIFHNAKYDIKLLKQNNLPFPENIHDTLIMSWLIDENSRHGLKELAKEILDKTPKKWNELNTTIDLFTTAEDVMKELAEYCCEDVKNTFLLYEHFYPQLEKEGVLVDYERVELKFIKVLIDMEIRGIKVDVSWLQKKQKEAIIILRELEDKIIKKIKEKSPKSESLVNIRSPKQLEIILFDLFRYPSARETKHDKRSTDNEVLEGIVKKFKLTDEDFVPMLLKFRDLDKVNGTYLVALAQQAGLTNIIHPNFMQHGTRTGRLSSNDPNMQNIPTRHDEWDVRRAFIAREGYKLLIADYSQVELRMLAHFSKDEHMVKTFLEGGDIHAKTMELTGITVRRIAKNVNFGMVYGVGPRTLSSLINTKEDEAKKYIEKFFRGYPQIRVFINRVQQKTFRTGYVEMITGRRRHFHEYKDNRWFNTIARQAINCVDGETECLTQRGWLKYNKLLSTDTLLTYNLDNKELQWQIPERINIHTVNETLIEFNHPNLSAISTKDHRWIIYDKYSKQEKIILTKNISNYGDHRIIRTGIYKGTSIYIDNFIRLIGWFLTDGWIKKESPTGIGICQSKENNIVVIRNLLKSLNIKFNESKKSKSGEIFWTIFFHTGRKLRRLFPRRILTMAFLNSISGYQAKILLTTMLQGDGSKLNGCDSFVFVCKSKEQADMFQILCVLASKVSRSYFRDMSKYAQKKSIKMDNIPKMGGYWNVIVQSRNKAQIYKRYKKELNYKGIVWCPTIKNTTFVARRNNTIYITGNTKIQGSSADLIKIAMIKLRGILKKFDAHMLLQIHDELIVEVPIDKVLEVKEVMRDTMINALKLTVPLDVTINESDRWTKE